MRSAKIGHSSRTPFKHWLANIEMGRQAGVLGNNLHMTPCRVSEDVPLLFIDQCAGNGEATEHSDKTSVSLILWHSSYKPLLGKVHVTLIERQPGTFSELEKNVPPASHIQLLNMDARDYLPLVVHPEQAVFVNCDPNSVDEIPLTERFMKELTPFTTMLITLGCNPHGIKRLIRQRRDEWYEYINVLTDSLSNSHDLLITSVVRDSSQWAYIVRLPAVWSIKSQNMYIAKGNKEFEHGVEVYSWRRNQKQFLDKLDYLFLTKKELLNESA